MVKKRLKKDLPFEGLAAGDVITRCDSGYFINLGEAWYSPRLSGADSGRRTFTTTEEAILDKIWDDSEWFGDLGIDNFILKIKVSRDKIMFTFDALDMEDAQLLAKGITHCISKYFKKDNNYVWNKFNLKIIT